jgi:hypothetical protein
VPQKQQKFRENLLRRSKNLEFLQKMLALLRQSRGPIRN